MIGEGKNLINDMDMRIKHLEAEVWALEVISSSLLSVLDTEGKVSEVIQKFVNDYLKTEDDG